MAEYMIQDSTLTNIANAIRTRSGTNTNFTMTPEEMAKYITSAKGNYINKVATSTSDGTNVYNSTGYKDNSYWSSGANATSTSSGYTSTGNIYLPADVDSIFIKGCAWDGSSTARFICGTNAGGLTYVAYSSGTGTHKIETFFTVTRIGTDYYKFTLTDAGRNYIGGKYYRFSLKGSGANLIITHDQLIW